MIHLNNLYGLGLNHHDINFMYSIYSGLKTGYYLKIRNPMMRLISCLPNSNRNSAREFVKVSGNWLAGELTCPTSPREIGRYSYFPSTPSLRLIAFVLPSPIPFFYAFHHIYIYIHNFFFPLLYLLFSI